jgi:hypothetical protein
LLFYCGGAAFIASCAPSYSNSNISSAGSSILAMRFLQQQTTHKTEQSSINADPTIATIIIFLSSEKTDLNHSTTFSQKSLIF